MENDKWGVGDRANSEAFDTILLGEDKDRPLDLIFGQYPHSRSDNNQYARTVDGEIFEFDGHRRLIDIQIKSYNYLKESYYSGDEIRKGVNIAIFSDGHQVYEEFSRNPEYALLQAHRIISQLMEHSSGWLSKSERDKLTGRKIYYREYPAIIQSLVTEQGCLIIAAEDGKAFPTPVYYNRDNFDEYETTMKVEVISPHIWWWRD